MSRIDLEFLTAWDCGDLDPEEYDPECECVQIDVDYFDARYCPAHGRAPSRGGWL